MGIKLAVEVVPSGNDVLILEMRAIREQLIIDIIQRLTVKALGPGVMETGDQLAVYKTDTSGC